MILPAFEEFIDDHGEGYAVLVDANGVEVSQRMRFQLNDGNDVDLTSTGSGIRWQIITLSGRIALDDIVPNGTVGVGMTLHMGGGIVLRP